MQQATYQAYPVRELQLGVVGRGIQAAFSPEGGAAASLGRWRTGRKKDLCAWQWLIREWSVRHRPRVLGFGRKI